MAASLLDSDNLCGSYLVRLVSRGAAIIAELQRLANNIPEVFLPAGVKVYSSVSGEMQGGSEAERFQSVLFDFAYLKDPEDYERQLNESTEMLDLDQEFQENHVEILERFYALFDSIVKYLQDLLKFVDDVQSGFYIQHTVETILLDTEGKQLMCEAFFLYGVMLLLLERRIPGPVRERMIIAMYRHVGEANLASVDDVCKLCRDTRASGARRPKNYPENYFGRFPIPEGLIRNIIGRLRSDDVYLMATSFPDQDHRSVRLAQQASMLYVLLYFEPTLLKNDEATMREVVDKHFNDNWMITIYMGHIVDLTNAWQPYAAARAALSNVLQPRLLRTLEESNRNLFAESLTALQTFLTEGVLQHDFVLDHMNALLVCLRKCNVALRWRILHRRSDHREMQTIMANSDVTPETVINLLLLTSQLEYRLKEQFGHLLDTRDEAWEKGKQQCGDRMQELSEYFTGEKALSRVERDENLMRYFAALAEKIRALDVEEGHATMTGRQIQGIISALEDVEQFEVMDTNLQIKAFLNDTRVMLHQMIRTVNIRQEVLNIMENITDFSYAWQAMDDYIRILHERIRKDPSSTSLLRAMFVKIASVLDVPMIRIAMCESPDQESVAEFYSSELVAFVRRVLDIIPISVFRVLSRIVDIQTNRLKPMPIRLEAKDLKDFAQLDVRYEMAQLTHEVSEFTEGVLAMEKTLLGVIQVDPRRILEDGLRKELVRRVSIAMDDCLVFQDTSIDAVHGVLARLTNQLEGFRRSIEYIQDYIDLPGLRIWQEEATRIINYNIEQECNRYLKRKVYDRQSKYQSKSIPIPRFPPRAGDESGAINFMGRLLSALLSLTDACTTTYAPECSGWYTAAGDEVCGIRTFGYLNHSLGAMGLRGLDKLLAFRIVFELGMFMKTYKETMRPNMSMIEQLREVLHPVNAIPPESAKLYAASVKRMGAHVADLLRSARRIGQAQLIRRQIANVLTFSCRLDASQLFEALGTLNSALLSDVRKHYRKPDEYPYPPEGNPILPELTTLLEASGLHDPLSKIYITTEPVEGLPETLLLFILNLVPKLQYDAQFATLVRRKITYPLDGGPLVVGLVTVLRQFHPSYLDQLLAYLGQFVRASVQTLPEHVRKLKPVDPLFPPEVLSILIFVDQLCWYSKLPRSIVYEYIPSYMFDAIHLTA